MTKHLLILVVACLLAGCGKIVSSETILRRPDHPPHAVIILGPEQPFMTEADRDGLNSALKAEFERCGLVAAVFSPDPLTLDPGKDRAHYLTLRQSIHADWTFTYRPRAVTTEHGISTAYLEAFVIDAHNSPIWVANFSMLINGLSYTDVIGRELVNHIAQAGLLGDCKPAPPIDHTQHDRQTRP